METLQNNYVNAAVRVLDGKYKDAILKLKPDETLIIGRDVKVCHLVLEAPWVSRKHCEIVYDYDRKMYAVTDYSENGTFLENGKPLQRNELQYLESGVILKIGENGNSMQLM